MPKAGPALQGPLRKALTAIEQFKNTGEDLRQRLMHLEPGDEAMALATRLAAGPTVSYGAIRRALQAAASTDYLQALLIEEEAQRISGNSQDCSEAVTAFLEKRPPVFRGE